MGELQQTVGRTGEGEIVWCIETCQAQQEFFEQPAFRIFDAQTEDRWQSQEVKSWLFFHLNVFLTVRSMFMVHFIQPASFISF